MSVASHPNLRALLADPARPDGTMTYGELHGFLFTVVNAPELIVPSEWMPQVFNEGEPVYASVEQMRAVMEEIMDVHNAVAAPLPEDGSVLPPGVEFQDPTPANLDADAPVAHWARGFVRGHTWLSESWDDLVPEDADEDLGLMTMTLSFFATRELAEALCREVSDAPVDGMAEDVRAAFPIAAADYARIGRLLARIVATPDDELPALAASLKIGRNDPCPCGSGRKYKKCCAAPPPVG